jgi:hypothetical protein
MVEKAGYRVLSNGSDFMEDPNRFNKQQEKFAALWDAIAVGIDQLDRGEGLDGEKVFAELLLDDERQR